MKGKSLISIIGAGSQGTLLALLISHSNKYHVKLIDNTEEALSHSHMYMENLLQTRISKGKIDHHDYYSIFQNISVSTDLSSIHSSNYVIESINEHFQSKAKLFSQIDEIIPSTSIIFSTTASLSITKLAAASKYPSRVAGLHLFAMPTPAKVVEIISGLQSSQDTIENACEFVQSLGKEPSVSQDHPGYIANKIIFSLINESINSLQSGTASKEDIDKTLKSVTGMTLGPLELADEIGLEVVLDNLKRFHKELGDDKYRPCSLLVNYVSAGWNGKKSGKGFYNYRK